LKIPAPDICRDAGGRKKGETEITDPGEAARIEQLWLKRNLKIPAFAGMTEGGSRNDICFGIFEQIGMIPHAKRHL
jgi:hypothetical protein